MTNDTPKPLTHAQVRKRIAPFRVKPGSDVDLKRDFDPGFHDDFVKKSDAAAALEEGTAQLCEYQERLAAADTHTVLVVLQALDAGGKDGTIKHVLSGLNPQAVSVRSFKIPEPTELQHDFLWRYQRALPERGSIGIFNRSHYEEVLVVRVHPENLDTQQLPDDAKKADVWKHRYRDINDWERYLVGNGVRIVKLFLHISKEEQRTRFLDRIVDPDKNWKFSVNDALERKHWDEYQAAYEQMLESTSTRYAPWHVVPADHKWFGRLAASWIILDTLMDIDPQYPKVDPEIRKQMQQIRKELEAEASKN